MRRKIALMDHVFSGGVGLKGQALEARRGDTEKTGRKKLAQMKSERH